MMPRMDTVLAGFEETIEFEIVKKDAQGGDVTESSAIRPRVFFEGALQPLHPRELLVKPEGERNWKWLTLFTDFELQNDWIVKDENGVLYRVMAGNSFPKTGYKQYQLVEGTDLDE